jgi:hypothetical protein
MDILHSFVHWYSHNIFERVQLIPKVIHEQTEIIFVGKPIKIIYRLTSSPRHPRVFVFRHSINRSAIVQNARIFPFVAWTKPTASIATQLRIVVGSAKKRIF